MKPQGIVKGQPIALFVLDYGLFRVHAGPRDIGICGFAIRTDAGENILIDGGFPSKYTRDPREAGREDDLDAFGAVLQCGPRNLPEFQLAAAGIAAQDVSLCVLTHTHIDHIGHLEGFAKAPVLVAAAERALPRPLYWGGCQPMDWPDRDYVLLESDTDLGPGLRALLVPGHAPGQIALMVDLPKTGPVLLTSDAISRPAEIDEGFAGSWDVAQAQANGARLMALAAERKATVIFGHCPEQWPQLRKAPEGYF